MSFFIFPTNRGNELGAVIGSPPTSFCKLGTFVVGNYSLLLRFDSVKGFFTSLSIDNRPLENVRLVAPFSNLRSITKEQLCKLASTLSAQYTIRISRIDNNQFQVEFNPKLLGGGAGCSCFGGQKEAKNKNQKQTAHSGSQNANNNINANLQNEISVQTSVSLENIENKLIESTSSFQSPLPPESPAQINSISPSSNSAPFSLSNIRSTFDLACALVKADPASDDHANLKKLAFKVITAYRDYTPKTPALFKELTALIQAGSSRISREILSILVTQLVSAVFLDEEILIALRDTIREIDASHLSPDELATVLKAIREKQACFHSQESNNDKLYILLHAHSGTLEALGDANVKQLSYEHLHDPLYKTLDGLSQHGDWRVAAEAAYAKEALLRVGHDKTKLSVYLGRLLLLAKGFGDIANVWTRNSLSPLFDAYNNFKEALHSQQKSHSWYDEFRFVSILLDKDFEEFEKYLLKGLDVPKNQQTFFFKNIVNLLIETVSHHVNPKIRLSSLQLLSDLYLDNPKWSPLYGCLPKPDADIKKNRASQIKVSLLVHFNAWANMKSSSDKVLIIVQSREVLKSILNSPISPFQQKWFELAQISTNLNLPSPSRKLARRSDAGFIEANTLLNIAKAQPRTALELIKEVRNNYLADKDLETLLSTYIAPSGSRHGSFQDPFILEKEILNFLELHSKEKVLLLLGGAGSGKTTYGKYLTYTLWKEWNENKPIPLFIPLGALAHPNAKIIEETLTKEGFSDLQIHQLKSEHSFVFILDGYDEMGRKPNLYEEKQLKNWNAKIIISCRSQDLTGGKSSNLALFAPIKDQGPDGSLLQELYITPFTEKEIDAYLQQYLNHFKTSPWKDYKEYRKHIDQIQGLASLISTPFLLYITAEVLPEIVERHAKEKPNEKLFLLRADLYEAFINNWFIRAEGKLRTAHRLDNFEGDIKLSFNAFCKKLAIKMYEKKITVVTYTPPVYGKADSEWEEFFGNKDPFVSLLRHGAPLQKIENNKHAFLHKTILDYFINLDSAEQDDNPDGTVDQEMAAQTEYVSFQSNNMEKEEKKEILQI